MQARKRCKRMVAARSCGERRCALWIWGAVMGVLLAAGCERVDSGPPISARPPVSATAVPVLPGRRATPLTRRIELGRSVQGRVLVLEVFGDGPDRVLVLGGLHGDEARSVFVARKLAGYLRADWDALAGRTVAILAEANPDGLSAGRRGNANSVDLNRNFPAKNWRRAKRHGREPASEPETRAIIRAMELIRPQRVVSIHSARRGRQCNNYDGPAHHLAEQMARRNGYPVRAGMGYPTPGSFGSWAGVDGGIPTITLELPGERSGVCCWQENSTALLAWVEAGEIAVGK